MEEEKEMIAFEIPKFRGQREDFPLWISNVDQVFTRYNIDEQEKFKVVIQKLRGHALEWWEKYKCTRRKKGKSKIKTWEKLRGKLVDAFTPTSYLHKHPFLSFSTNKFTSSSKSLLSKKKSPTSVNFFSLTSFPCLENLTYNKNEKVPREEDLSLVDQPRALDDQGEKETFEPEVQRIESKQEEIVQEEIVQQTEQSLTQEGCQEDIEVNLSIAPGIEEIEQLLIQEECPIELQVPELEPCEVIKEDEQFLIQEALPLPSKELLLTPLLPIEPRPIFHTPLTLFFATLQMWPYDLFPQKTPFESDNPLSLRTNSKQPGEYDVYVHIHHDHSSSPTSWKIKFQQNHEWDLLILAPLSEFYDKRHLTAFLSIFKVPLLKENAKKGSLHHNPVFEVTFGQVMEDPQLEGPYIIAA